MQRSTQSRPWRSTTALLVTSVWIWMSFAGMASWADCEHHFGMAAATMVAHSAKPTPVPTPHQHRPHHVDHSVQPSESSPHNGHKEHTAEQDSSSHRCKCGDLGCLLAGSTAAAATVAWDKPVRTWQRVGTMHWHDRVLASYLHGRAVLPLPLAPPRAA